jgi:uncharacterized protein (TIGR03435 family)
MPRFEVTSVKLAGGCGDEGGRGGGRTRNWSPGRLDLNCVTVMDLIRTAYVQFAGGKRNPQGRQVPIEGGPSWINSATYRIDAKAEGAPGIDMMSGPMMQGLLEDRFRLKISRKTRMEPVYALTVAKGGPKLEAAHPGGCITVDHDHPPPLPRPGQPLPRLCGGFFGNSIYGTTMESFCFQLSAMADHNVIDKTGLNGLFDIHFEISAADLYDDLNAADQSGTGDAPPSGASFFNAIRSSMPKLGLKLSLAKGPEDFFIVTHVERPSAN